MPVLSVELELKIHHPPADTAQYAGLQEILMGVYNIPFIVVSVVSLLLSIRYAKLMKKKQAAIAVTISILASVLSCLYMLDWALGSTT